MHKKVISVYYILIIVVLLLSFVLSSCSYGQADGTDSSGTDVMELQATTEIPADPDDSGEVDGIKPEESAVSYPSGTDIASGDEQDNIADQNTDIYTDMKIQIEQASTIYADISAGSVKIEIDRGTGNIKGFIFLGYMEVKMRQGKSYPCENVIKGSVTGILDPATGEISGEVKGEITGEGRECFTGPIILKLAGRLIKEGQLIEGGINLPSGNRLYFILEKEVGEA